MSKSKASSRPTAEQYEARMSELQIKDLRDSGIDQESKRTIIRHKLSKTFLPITGMGKASPVGLAVRMGVKLLKDHSPDKASPGITREQEYAYAAAGKYLEARASAPPEAPTEVGPSVFEKIGTLGNKLLGKGGHIQR